MPNFTATIPRENEPRWKMWLSLCLMLVGLQLVAGPKIVLSEWHVDRIGNTALEEAVQWKNGTMSLTRDYIEDANIGDKTYNVVGYAFVLISLIGTTISSLLLGCPPDQFHPAIYVALVALPLPFVAFWAFREVTNSSPWSAVLTVYLIVGTPFLPVLRECRPGSIYQINHLLAVIGLLMLGGDTLGRFRVWPSILGLWLAVWSRQLTCFYAIPLLDFAFAKNATLQSSSSSPEQAPLKPAPTVAQSHRTRIVLTCIGLAIAAGFPMILNTLKFGNPLDFGYRYIYLNGRVDPVAKLANEAFFSPRYWSIHLPSLTWGYPIPDIRRGELFLDTTNGEGASIWLTSPLLLGIFITARQWWKDRDRRWLMLATVPVLIGLMSYHTTGGQMSGYYRYALDYIPIWLLVIAPSVLTDRGKPLVLACLAYSALYFNLLR